MDLEEKYCSSRKRNVEKEKIFNSRNLLMGHENETKQNEHRGD